MEKELVIKKCSKCGTTMNVIKDCTCENCGITCCGEFMQEEKANTTNADIKKHAPTYEIKEDYIKVKVNHIMEKEHYIEWICLKAENIEKYIYLTPGEEATAVFRNVESGILYAYCNHHGLWSTKIEK